MSKIENKNTGDSWMQHMLNGEFAEAWKISDTVLAARAGVPCVHLPRHQQYFWDGTPLHNKRVLVRCYHGLGDTIQFIRYAPWLKSIVRELTIWAQPELIPLLQTMRAVDKLLPLHEGAPEVDLDADIEVMELPHIHRTTIATIPSDIPYLYVTPISLSKQEQQLKVGLVWRAGEWDPRRHLSFESLKPLCGGEGIEYYILQADPLRAGWEQGYGVHPGDYSLFDYARVLKGLDLLISVDSMPAHLAGAIGNSVWTLLHANADWRWMAERLDSPWYPTMRLFRQERLGDWDSVVKKVKAALQALIKSKTKQAGQKSQAM
jgi:hypothetical protein